MGLLATPSLADQAVSMAPAAVGSPAASDAVEFELLFPLRNSTELDRLIEAQSTPGSPDYQKFLSVDEFRQRFGMTDETVAAATRSLNGAGLAVSARHAQGLRVRGTIGAVETAFGARFALVRDKDGRIAKRGMAAPTLPPELARLGARAPELASLVSKRPALRRAASPQNRLSPTGSYWFDDLKQA